MHSALTPKSSEETDPNNNVSVKGDEFDGGMAEKTLDNDGNVIRYRVRIISAIQRVVE
jgi:hypothetical protein